MIAFYCADERMSAKFRSPLAAVFDLSVYEAWEPFRDNASNAECGIVVVRRLSKDEVFHHLRRLMYASARLRVVLVTESDPANSRNLKDILVDEVIWFEESPQSLIAAVERARVRSCLSGVAAAIDSATGLPWLVRRALCLACSERHSISKVSELAATVGCDSSMLRKQWRKAVSPKADLRLEDFIDWVLLLRAVEIKQPNRSWVDVASELRVHEDTLQRIARRFMESSLRHLAAETTTELLPRFQERFLRSLVGSDPKNPF